VRPAQERENIMKSGLVPVKDKNNYDESTFNFWNPIALSIGF
jgi:hypothetical protein